MDPPVTTQPAAGAGQVDPFAPGAPGSGGSVTIRNLTNTREDCAFAGRLSVEAFRSKMVHATSERRLPSVIDRVGLSHQDQDPFFYERFFIAEVDNERAGLLTLKLHKDPMPKDNGAFNDMGCCDLYGVICLEVCTSSSPPQDACYIEYIAVDEKHRGKGIGKLLLQRADYEAKRNGCKMIYLYVVASNPRAKSLYEREGYEVKGTKCCCMWCATGESKAYRMEKPL